MIVVGLLPEVQEEIDREEVVTVGKLFNELQKQEIS